jgi:putative membrane-bound dehydrogenase-like protein
MVRIISLIVVAALVLTVVSYTKPEYGFNARQFSTDTVITDQRLPENALKGLDVAYGLKVQLMATEPMLKNPTNIDVDEKGRIWVIEAYNYRPGINGNPTNAEGDRIMILEDKDGDAKVDVAKVFYQGPELNAPLGIAVLGNKVIVAQSPYIWAFYDDNGDDKADRKEIMFQGIQGEQHDHGAHAFTFGPDGKLYFNVGNEGKTLKDKNGKIVLDQDGDEIGPAKYKQGMVFRCDPDGTNVECLGDNFRNPFEVAVDSYGTMWQSDNDDDGNKGTRINYVMPYGNYGYSNEMTGASWSSTRNNMEDSIPFRHWHLNDPGSIPNMLQTGAGSPTGILVYEGKLMPEAFQHQLIHADAGPNVVRAYPVIQQGAGYSAGIINILKGGQDKWFRPADVCVAPDGSLIVADWYDPGVGGHQAGDQSRGRIYRVAPADAAAYKVPPMDLTTPAGAVQALQSPNLAVRFHAYNALHGFGKKSVAPLEQLWKSGSDPAMRARAFWALVTMADIKTEKYIKQAQKESDLNLRILALRAVKRLKGDPVPVVNALKNDADPMVRRECALALHHLKSPEAPKLWAELAARHDGQDRWYLEALGIGADAQWDSFFAAYTALVKDPLSTAGGRDVVWRARTDAAVPYLSSLATDGTQPLQARLRYFRAFDFNPGAAANTALLNIIEGNKQNDIALNKLALYSLNSQTVNQSATAQKALKQVLDDVYPTQQYLDLVGRFDVKSENARLLDMAISKNGNDLGTSASRLLLSGGGTDLIWNEIRGNDATRSKAMLNALSRVGSTSSVDILQKTAFTEAYPEEIRKYAANRIGKSGEGERRVLKILKDGQVPPAMIPDVVASVSGAWRESVRTEAKSYLPKSEVAAEEVAGVPTLEQLNALKADVAKGKAVYAISCAVCHKMDKDGYDFGPKLSEIGSKYGKDGLLKSIVSPSDGISFGYEGWSIKMKDGSELMGIISSKTNTEIEVRLPGGAVQKVKASSVKSMEQMKVSMMPVGLTAAMSAQDLADLLGYLESRKKM